MNKIWYNSYLIAKDYYERYGNLEVKARATFAGFDLGPWLSVQRENNNKGILKTQYKNLLDEIGMIWDVLDYNWRVTYSYAVLFYEQNHHLDVPRDYVIDGVHLGYWIIQQRAKYKKGTLKPEYIDLLNKIGMIWQKRQRDDWEYCYKLACDYYQKNHNLLIPYTYTICGINLGFWISNQRRFYKNGVLTKERIAKLEAIGMVWDTYEVKNALGLKLCKDYFEKHGDLFISSDYVMDGFELGKWLNGQKRKLRKGNANSDFKEFMEKNNIDLTKRTDNKWYLSYHLAEEFYQEHHHLLIPRDYIVCGNNLERWVRTQRANYAKGLLSPQKTALLNEIEMIWDMTSYRLFHKQIKTREDLLKIRQKLEEILYDSLATYEENQAVSAIQQDVPYKLMQKL